MSEIFLSIITNNTKKKIHSSVEGRIFTYLIVFAYVKVLCLEGEINETFCQKGSFSSNGFRARIG